MDRWTEHKKGELVGHPNGEGSSMSAAAHQYTFLEQVQMLGSMEVGPGTPDGTASLLLRLMSPLGSELQPLGSLGPPSVNFPFLVKVM